MKQQKKKELESVKLEVAVVDKVRKVKEATGVTISRFIQDAIIEKISKIK
jgi:hypothetical protein